MEERRRAEIEQVLERRRLRRIERNWGKHRGKWISSALRIQRLWRGVLGRRVASRLLKQRKNALKADMHVYKARALLVKSDDHGALQELNAAIELNRKCTHAYGLRGQIRYHRQNLASAVQDLSVALDGGIQGDDHFLARVIRAQCRSRERQFEAAIEDLSAAIQQRSRDAELYRMRGIFYTQVKDYRSAAFDFGKFLDYSTEEACIQDLVLRAMAYSCDHEYMLAENDIKSALECQGSDDLAQRAELFVLLSRIRACLRDYQGALAACHSALEANPESQAAKECLEEISPTVCPYPMLSESEMGFITSTRKAEAAAALRRQLLGPIKAPPVLT